MTDIGFFITYTIGEILAILTDMVVLVGAVIYVVFGRR